MNNYILKKQLEQALKAVYSTKNNQLKCSQNTNKILTYQQIINQKTTDFKIPFYALNDKKSKPITTNITADETPANYQRIFYGYDQDEKIYKFFKFSEKKIAGFSIYDCFHPFGIDRDELATSSKTVYIFSSYSDILAFYNATQLPCLFVLGGEGSILNQVKSLIKYNPYNNYVGMYDADKAGIKAAKEAAKTINTCIAGTTKYKDICEISQNEPQLIRSLIETNNTKNNIDYDIQECINIATYFKNRFKKDNKKNSINSLYQKLINNSPSVHCYVGVLFLLMQDYFKSKKIPIFEDKNLFKQTIEILVKKLSSDLTQNKYKNLNINCIIDAFYNTKEYQQKLNLILKKTNLTEKQFTKTINFSQTVNKDHSTSVDFTAIEDREERQAAIKKELHITRTPLNNHNLKMFGLSMNQLIDGKYNIFLNWQTGAGKTSEFLLPLYNELKRQGKKVVFITASRLLSKIIAEMFGIYDYEKEKEDYYIFGNETEYKKSCSMCIESIDNKQLQKIINNSDVVVFDEIQSTLQMLASEIKKKRKYIKQKVERFRIFREILKYKPCIFADANLCDEDIQLLQNENKNILDKSILFTKETLTTKKANIILPCIIDNNQDINEQVLCLALRDMHQGLTPVFSCESKKHADQIKHQIKESITSSNILKITSNTTDKKHIKEFLKDTNNINKYDAFIYTSCINSGISVVSNKTANTYANYNFGILSTSQAIQQLHRTRTSDATTVLKPCYNSAFIEKKIKIEIEKIRNSIKGAEDTPDYTIYNEFKIEQKYNRSIDKIDGISIFIAKMIKNGYGVNIVSDIDSCNEVAKKLKAIKKNYNAEQIRLIKEAPKFTKKQYESYVKNPNEEYIYSAIKYELENIIKKDLSNLNDQELKAIINSPYTAERVTSNIIILHGLFKAQKTPKDNHQQQECKHLSSKPPARSTQQLIESNLKYKKMDKARADFINKNRCIFNWYEITTGSATMLLKFIYNNFILMKSLYLIPDKFFSKYRLIKMLGNTNAAITKPKGEIKKYFEWLMHAKYKETKNKKENIYKLLPESQKEILNTLAHTTSTKRQIALEEGRTIDNCSNFQYLSDDTSWQYFLSLDYAEEIEPIITDNIRNNTEVKEAFEAANKNFTLAAAAFREFGAWFRVQEEAAENGYKCKIDNNLTLHMQPIKTMQYNCIDTLLAVPYINKKSIEDARAKPIPRITQNNKFIAIFPDAEHVVLQVQDPKQTIKELKKITGIPIKDFEANLLQTHKECGNFYVFKKSNELKNLLLKSDVHNIKVITSKEYFLTGHGYKVPSTKIQDNSNTKTKAIKSKIKSNNSTLPAGLHMYLAEYEEETIVIKSKQQQINEARAAKSTAERTPYNTEQQKENTINKIVNGDMRNWFNYRGVNSELMQPDKTYNHNDKILLSCGTIEGHKLEFKKMKGNTVAKYYINSGNIVAIVQSFAKCGLYEQEVFNFKDYY